MHLNMFSWFGVQDSRVYDLDILEFLHGKLNLNWFSNLEKIGKLLDIHYKYRYEKHYIRQMHIINNDLCIDHEILLHGLLQLNVLHSLSLNSVLRHNSVEKRYPTNLLCNISMYDHQYISCR